MEQPSKKELEKICGFKLMNYQYEFLKAYLSLPEESKLCLARKSHNQNIVLAQLVDLFLTDNSLLNNNISLKQELKILRGDK